MTDETEVPKVLKKIEAALAWLNGKKTAIGGALQTLAYIGSLVYPAGAVVWQPMQAVGAILTGAGLGHKAVKMTRTANARP